MLNNSDNWEKLMQRLRSANGFGGQRGSPTQGERVNGRQSAAIIKFRLYFQQGELVGWSRPESILLEPSGFDLTIFDLQTVQAGWNGVFIDLKRECSRGVSQVEKTLVIRENGEPAGWFADRVKGGGIEFRSGT
jgi:hypothetical protein